MQEYLQKTHLSVVMDEVGAWLALLSGSLGLFMLLWGIRPMAVLAGLAAFTLCMLLRTRTREKRLRQKEARLRRRIGGEMKLEAWTTCPPRQAHFETALLLSGCRPLVLERMTDSGVLCLLPDLNIHALVACALLMAACRANAAKQRPERLE